MNTGHWLYGSRSLSSLSLGCRRSGRLYIHSLQRTGSHMGSRLSESNTAAQTILYHTVGLIFQTGSDHGDRTAIGLGLIVHSPEDDIDIISCQFLYIACCIGCICQSDISGDIDNDMGCTGNGSLQKGTLYCHLHSFHCLHRYRCEQYPCPS